MSHARAEALKRQTPRHSVPINDGRVVRRTDAGRTAGSSLPTTTTTAIATPTRPSSRVEPPSWPGITIRGNKPVSEYVSYTSYGHTRMTNGALQMGTLHRVPAGLESGRRRAGQRRSRAGRPHQGKMRAATQTCPRRQFAKCDAFRMKTAVYGTWPQGAEPSIPSTAPLVSLPLARRPVRLPCDRDEKESDNERSAGRPAASRLSK